MKDETSKYLYDIRDAVLAITRFVKGMTFDVYTEDELIRSGVERKFEIAGEALNKLRTVDPELVERIREYRSIISFRNILAHGYDTIDDRIVWGIIQEDLNNLLIDVNRLLEGKDPLGDDP